MKIKPTAPKFNIYIKTHKENQPIKPVINNTQAPSYKIAKHLNKKLSHLICLPHTYNTKNSQEVAEQLKNIQIKFRMVVPCIWFEIRVNYQLDANIRLF